MRDINCLTIHAQHVCFFFYLPQMCVCVQNITAARHAIAHAYKAAHRLLHAMPCHAMHWEWCMRITYARQVKRRAKRVAYLHVGFTTLIFCLRELRRMLVIAQAGCLLTISCLASCLHYGTTICLQQLCLLLLPHRDAACSIREAYTYWSISSSPPEICHETR